VRPASTLLLLLLVLLLLLGVVVATSAIFFRGKGALAGRAALDTFGGSPTVEALLAAAGFFLRAALPEGATLDLAFEAAAAGRFIAGAMVLRSSVDNFA